MGLMPISDNETGQSPIDLPLPHDSSSNMNMTLTCEDALSYFEIRPEGLFIRCNGELVINNWEYQMIDFHFHSPSEHHVNGNSFDLEMHVVHQNEKGNLLVVAYLFRTGKENPFINEVWKQLPPTSIGFKVNYLDIFVNRPNSYYAYSGSRTTAPFDTPIQWLVCTKIQELSENQLSHYLWSEDPGNNRGIQALNNRPIVIVENAH